MFCTIFEIQGPVLVVTFDRLVHCDMEFCHSASLFNFCLSERGDSLTICTLLKFLAFVGVDLISVRTPPPRLRKCLKRLVVNIFPFLI